VNRFEPGDLLLFYGRTPLSRLIEVVTWGPSHVALCAWHHSQGLLLYESTTLCPLPDALLGVPLSGVQAHQPEERIAAYDGRVARLAPAALWRYSRFELHLMAKMLAHLHTCSYDTAGALVSGTCVFKWTALMPWPDLASLFCSELVTAVLMRLGRMPLANPALYNPASLVRKLRRCGTYTRPEVLK
jgi:hypothetical protein